MSKEQEYIAMMGSTSKKQCIFDGIFKKQKENG